MPLIPFLPSLPRELFWIWIWNEARDLWQRSRSFDHRDRQRGGREGLRQAGWRWPDRLDS